MLTYAIRRLLAAIPVLLFSTFVMFWVVSSANDPLAELRINCPNCSASAYDRLTDLYNLDQPIPQRYLNWLGGAVTGDFGVSPEFGEAPVAPIVRERAINTLYLAIPDSTCRVYGLTVVDANNCRGRVLTNPLQHVESSRNPIGLCVGVPDPRVVNSST